MTATVQTMKLVFPEGDPLGEIFARDADGRWVSVAQAVGNVSVPPAAALRIDIRPQSPGEHFPKEVDFSPFTFLSLEGTAVTDHELESLSRFPNLETLNLAHTAIGGYAIEHLNPLSQLRSLSLSGTGIDSAALDGLSALKELRHLFLSDTAIDDEATLIIGSLTALQSLHLAGSQLTGTGLAALRSLTSLRDVSLPENLENESLGVLAYWPELEALSIRSESIDAGAAKYLAPLAKLRFLAAPRGFDDVAMAEIAHLTRLRSLWLSSASITEKGLEAISTLPELEDLYLHCPFPGREAEVLASFPKLKRLALFCATLRVENVVPLENLVSLRHFQFGAMDLDGESITRLRHFSCVTDIQITASSLTSRDLATARGLLHHARISHSPRLLQLPENRIKGQLESRVFDWDSPPPWQPVVPTSRGYVFPVDREWRYSAAEADVRELEDLLQIQGLEILEMSFDGCYIGAEVAGLLPYYIHLKTLLIGRCQLDMRFFHNLRLLRNLATVNLDFTNFGDLQAELLAKSPYIRMLSVRATSLTDRGLLSLAELSSLEALNIQATKTTPEGVAEFARRRPAVKLS